MIIWFGMSFEFKACSTTILERHFVMKYVVKDKAHMTSCNWVIILYDYLSNNARLDCFPFILHILLVFFDSGCLTDKRRICYLTWYVNLMTLVKTVQHL